MSVNVIDQIYEDDDWMDEVILVDRPLMMETKLSHPLYSYRRDSAGWIRSAPPVRKLTLIPTITRAILRVASFVILWLYVYCTDIINNSGLDDATLTSGFRFSMNRHYPPRSYSYRSVSTGFVVAALSV